MNKTLVSVIFRSIALILLALPPIALADSEPWTLRDHYNIGDDLIFQLDPKRAEWRVVADRADANVKSVYTQIELGDGTLIRLSKSNWITDGRDRFSDGFGNGIRIRSEFKPFDGLHVELHLNRYDSQAFMTFVIIVRNTGAKPISIKAVRHAVVEPGALARVGSGDFVLNTSLRRGVHTVLQGDGQVNLTEFRVDGSSRLLGLGLLQSGYMHSSINLTEKDTNLSGTIESTFSPAIQMMPGGSAQSDPLWILLSGGDPEAIHMSHAYSQSFGLTNGGLNNQPNGWMSAPEHTSTEDFLLAVQEWKSRSIHHALVPRGWQSPETTNTTDMGNLAQAIRDAGMIPGITIDPLQSSRSIPGITIRADDGSHWLDISKPDARAHGAKSLRQLVNWKYEFFVIAPTNMPDQIFSELNITSSVADRVAFELMFSAAAGKPVMPSPGITIGNDADAWQAAARSTSANTKYNILTGPARLDVRGLTELSNAVNNAIALFPGPVEILGQPDRKVRRQIAQSVPTLDND